MAYTSEYTIVLLSCVRSTSTAPGSRFTAGAASAGLGTGAVGSAGLDSDSARSAGLDSDSAASAGLDSGAADGIVSSG